MSAQTRAYWGVPPDVVEVLDVPDMPPVELFDPLRDRPDDELRLRCERALDPVRRWLLRIEPELLPIPLESLMLPLDPDWPLMEPD